MGSGGDSRSVMVGSWCLCGGGKKERSKPIVPTSRYLLVGSQEFDVSQSQAAGSGKRYLPIPSTSVQARYLEHRDEYLGSCYYLSSRHQTLKASTEGQKQP